MCERGVDRSLRTPVRRKPARTGNPSARQPDHIIAHSLGFLSARVLEFLASYSPFFRPNIRDKSPSFRCS